MVFDQKELSNLPEDERNLAIVLPQELLRREAVFAGLILADGTKTQPAQVLLRRRTEKRWYDAIPLIKDEPQSAGDTSAQEEKQTEQD